MKRIAILTAVICAGAGIFFSEPCRSEIPSTTQTPVSRNQEAPLPKNTSALQIQGGKLGIVGVHYQPDAAVIDPRYQEQLQKIAEVLNSEKLHTARILIKGHSDSRGSEKHNLELSRLRARNAMELMVGQFGVDESRLTFDGAGESAPIASNETEEGRYLNRRIEFIYLGEINSAKPDTMPEKTDQP